MNLKLMKKLCRLNKKQLKQFLKEYLREQYNDNYADFYFTDSYLMVDSDWPCCLVAHLDTVFAEGPRSIFYDSSAQVMWSPDGLGADDRAGIYAIIQLIEEGIRPSIIITDGEEMGGLGATQLIKDFPICPIQNLKYIIELDRAGENDCVFYGCDNPEFTKYIESFGFKTQRGSFSDISFIAPQWEIAAVNLSIGYEDEHTRSEALYIKNTHKTIDKVLSMIMDIYNVDTFKYIRAKLDTCCCCGMPIQYGSGTKVSFLQDGVRVEDVICDICYVQIFDKKDKLY